LSQSGNLLAENLQAGRIAREILVLSRNLLLVRLRFLDASLHQLKLTPAPPFPYLSTDGQHLFFEPLHVLEAYKPHQEKTARDYLHVVFHCLFHHLFINNLVHQDCWDLACDIAVEHAINDLGLAMPFNARAGYQSKVIQELKSKLTLLTAEKIYRYYLDQNLDEERLWEIRAKFIADDHELWYRPPQPKPQPGGEGQESGEEEEEQDGAGGRADKQGSEGNLKQKEDGLGEEDTARSQLDKQQLKDLWKEISDRAQVEIETLQKQWGNTSGGLHQGLNAVNRERYNYASFLKRFSVLGEAMQVNDDEFDLIFYTYGLKLYSNLPLIEPLEYKEVKRIKEFVIAIDTSGWVQGKTVQMFIQKTYNILKQTESFFTRINLHIIQCDADLQEDHKITTAEEFEEYIKTMQLRGFGGTDFRPVFAYVDQLIDEGEFENLKGLIYFTDGYGTYPARKPEYDTAFVFLDEDYVETPDVPPWAIKLILSTDDVMEGEVL
jgi:predicted metal-dependent peptidase